MALKDIPSETDPKRRGTEGEGPRAVNKLNARREFIELRKRGKDVVRDDGRNLPMISLLTFSVYSVLFDHSEAFARVQEPITDQMI